MNPGERAQLCWLIDRLVDGEATPQQVRELERLAGTPEGRKLYIEYLLMLGELHWGTFGASAVGKSVEDAAVSSSGFEGLLRQQMGSHLLDRASGLRRPLPLRRWWWVVSAAVAALVVAALIVGGLRSNLRQPGSGRQPVLALCTGQFQAVFGGGSVAAQSKLHRGDRVVLRSGLAEWQDHHGTRWVAEGPAVFSVLESERLHLESGKLVVHLARHTHGFTVDTPHARLLDRGTAFAVAVSSKGTEVHVLSGRVAVKAYRYEKDFREITTGQAVTVTPDGESRELPWAGDRFWANVPQKGSVAAYRFAATHHPRMGMFIPFEDTRAGLRCLALGDPCEVIPVMMRGTFSAISPELVAGYDGHSRAVRLIRGRSGGNAWGLGWQTENPVQFPRQFAVEIIFRFDGWPDLAPETVGCLLATRRSPKECGFLLAALPSPGGDRGQAVLAHLLEGTADWTMTRGRLIAGHWYYVAATFEGATPGESTHVVTYLLDLSTRESGLRRIFDGVIPGQVPPGRLGIGKGFDERLAHAYPFPGAIDEVCLYNDKVEEDTWHKHGELLLPTKELAAPMPLPD